MKKYGFWTLFILLLTIFPSTTSSQTLETVVQSQLGQKDISVSLRSIEDGELLYSKNGDVGMKPASTLKLLTAAAALDILGTNYRFQTKFYIDGKVDGDILNGDIYIKGEGDPTLQKKNFIAFTNALKNNGIQKIKGNIFGDDFFFSGPQLTPGVAVSDESYYYAARTTALTMSPDKEYNAGTLIVNVQPTAIGKPPKFNVYPDESGMIIQNKALTTPSNTEETVLVERQNNTNIIHITGNIPMNSTFEDWVTLNDPTINTLYTIKNTMAEYGITFIQDPKIERKKVPKKAKLLFTKHSIPLKSILIPFLKLSNNSIADILVKTLGKEVFGVGSTESGVQVLFDYGTVIGLKMNRWFLEDGSGISHQNSVAANELTSLLYIIRNGSNFAHFYDSLPIGGQKDKIIGGSLRKRFDSAPYKDRVVAKTGSISGVYALSGYVKAQSGQTYAFAVMTQNQSTSTIKAIDEIVKIIINTY